MAKGGSEFATSGLEGQEDVGERRRTVADSRAHLSNLLKRGALDPQALSLDRRYNQGHLANPLDMNEREQTSSRESGPERVVMAQRRRE